MDDEIMASGRARVLHRCTGKMIVITDRHGHPRWHEIWNGVPFLVDRHDDTISLSDGPGCRPYIDRVRQGRIIFDRQHRPVPGTIVLTEGHIRNVEWLAETKYIVLEPHIKGTQSADNKDWGWRNWHELALMLREALIYSIQFCRGKRRLPHVHAINDTSFHDAAAFIKNAQCVVTTDGGLHHAAAAVDTPAVVIWGGYSSPDVLGYEYHWNIYHAHPQSPCGRLSHCRHCRERMAEITVDEVYRATMEVLKWKH